MLIIREIILRAVISIRISLRYLINQGRVKIIELGAKRVIRTERTEETVMKMKINTKTQKRRKESHLILKDTINLGEANPPTREIKFRIAIADSNICRLILG